MISKAKQRTHERMLIIAAQVAELGNIRRHRFGAILTNNKTIISSGNNSTKTHPDQLRLNKYRPSYKHNCSFVHAEVNCISKLRSIPDNCTLYIVRVMHDNTFSIARPCEGCMEKIKDAGIKTIVYSTDHGFAVEHINSNRGLTFSNQPEYAF